MGKNPIIVRIPQMLQKEAERYSKIADWRPVMELVAELMHGEIRDNIRKGGRPTPFTPLNKLYKTEKIAAGYNPMPLRRTLALFNSLAASHSDTEALVSTNKIYAAIHHYGGKIKPKNKKALDFMIGGKRVTRRSVTIPARPYMFVTDEGFSEIDKVVELRVLKMLGIK